MFWGLNISRGGGGARQGSKILGGGMGGQTFRHALLLQARFILLQNFVKCLILLCEGQTDEQQD